MDLCSLRTVGNSPAVARGQGRDMLQVSVGGQLQGQTCLNWRHQDVGPRKDGRQGHNVIKVDFQ